MSWTEDKKEWAKKLTLELYKNEYIETIFNTKDSKHYRGWILKGGTWSPWYLNLRPIGSTPNLLNDIGFIMNKMLKEEVPNLDLILGIEMAGIPIATISGAYHDWYAMNYNIPFAYTRPLPEGKVRTPEEARQALAKLEEKNKYDEWGGHQLIEGRLESGQSICIVDDMVTNLGSKLIAKEILFYEKRRLRLENIICNDIAVVLDREQGAEEAAEKEGMKLYSLIKFKTDGLDWLKDVMDPVEYEIISKFQKYPNAYQDSKLQGEAIRVAAGYRKTEGR